MMTVPVFGTSTTVPYIVSIERNYAVVSLMHSVVSEWTFEQQAAVYWDDLDMQSRANVSGRTGRGRRISHSPVRNMGWKGHTKVLL